MDPTPVPTTKANDAEPIESPAQTITSDSSRQAKIDKVINYALSNVGGAYIWGGASYRACDCSGLMLLAYAQIGISLPHYAASQAYYGTNVAYNDMLPGDMIFFGYGSYSSIYHVGMYIGNGRMVEAQCSETGIVISNLSNVLTYSQITAIKRLI